MGYQQEFIRAVCLKKEKKKFIHMSIGTFKNILYNSKKEVTIIKFIVETYAEIENIQSKVFGLLKKKWLNERFCLGNFLFGL
jgi:hypothetical protein